MSDHYQDVHFPDHDHLKHFPADAYSEGPEEGGSSRKRRGGRWLLADHARPKVIFLAIAIGFALGLLIALTNCGVDTHGSIPIRDERATPENKAKRHQLLHDQHKDFDKAQREFRMP